MSDFITPKTLVDLLEKETTEEFQQAAKDFKKFLSEVNEKFKTLSRRNVELQVANDLLSDCEEKLLKSFGDLKFDLGKMKSEKSAVEGRCVALLLQLDGRGSIDRVEEYFFPTWLTHPTFKLSRSQKWTLALELGLSEFAVAFRKKCPKRIASHTVGKIIEELHDKWAKTFTHRRKLNLPEEERGWSEIYTCLEIESKNEKFVIRKILEELEGCDEDDTENDAQSAPQSNVTTVPTGTSSRGFVIINNVNRNATLDEILKFFESQKITDIKVVHLMDSVHTGTPSKKSDLIGALVPDINRIPHVISLVPTNLCYPSDYWTLVASFRESEP